MQTADKTKRLLKCDPRTKKGNKDNDYVLITETNATKVTRYRLQSEKPQTIDTFTQLARCPDNIQINTHGEFWVTQNNCGIPKVKVKPIRLNEGGKCDAPNPGGPLTIR